MKTAYIFDMDDTIVFWDGKIKTYEAEDLLTLPTFRHIPEVFEEFRRLAMESPLDVFLLSAGHFKKAMEKFVGYNGLKIPNANVFSVLDICNLANFSNVAKQKASVVKEIISKQYKEIHMYDDSEDVIYSVGKVAEELKIAYYPHLVKF